MENSNIKRGIYPLSKSLYKVEFFLVLAFFIRILFLFLSKKLNYFSDFSSSLDIKYYEIFANNLFHFNIKGGLPVFVNQLNILIYLLFVPFKFNSYIMRIFFIVLDVFNIYLLYKLSKKLFKKNSLFPVIFYTFFSPFIIYSNYPLGETLVITFLILFLFYMHDNPLLAGIFIAAASLGRGNLIIFLLFYLVYIIIRKEFKWVFVLGIVIVFTPFFLKNLIAFNKPSPISSQGTINLFIGNNNYATGGYIPLFNNNFNMENLNSMKNKHFIQKALNFTIKNPLIAFKLYAKKIYLLFSEYSPPLNLNYYFIKMKIPLLDLFFGFAILFALFFPIVIFDLRGNKELIILELFLIISLLPFFLSLRYKLFISVIPILLIANYKFTKKYIFTTLILFILLNFIPRPFQISYGFTGKYMQIAEIDYNNGRQLIAEKELMNAKKYRIKKNNIGPDLFQPLIYRNNNNTQAYLDTMQKIYLIFRKYKNVSYFENLKNELQYLKNFDPYLYEKFKKIPVKK